MSSLFLYRLLTWGALPLVLLRLWYRGMREPGYRLRRGERLGRYKQPAPAAPLIWVHAVSLGETMAARELVPGLLRANPGHQLLLTSVTATGQAAARDLFQSDSRVSLAWLPYDYRFAVKGFLDHFRPRLGIIMETELWPNLLLGCSRRSIPVMIANARLSERSAARYALFRGLARSIMSAPALIAAQSDADAARFRALGAPRVEVAGNMKFDVAHQQHPATAELRRRLGPRKVLLAASVREGEEQLLMEAWSKHRPDAVLLVIVPRHPQRFAEVAALLRRYDPGLVLRSQNRDVPHACRIFLGDSMGEMAAYYACCHCAFIGGSLLDYGGQNLIEACAAGVPVLFGPHTYNFAQAADAALAAGAGIRIASAGQLFEESLALLGDDRRRVAMGEAALAFSRSHQGATGRTIELCCRLLRPDGERISPGLPADG